MTNFNLSRGEYQRLRESTKEGHLGPDFAVECNVDQTDSLRARRIGPSGSGLGARAMVTTTGTNGGVVAYLAAPQIREFAAHLLNVADDIDGATPLAFVPRGPIALGEGPTRTRHETEPEPEPVTDPAAVTPGIVGLVLGLAAFAALPIARRFLR